MSLPTYSEINGSQENMKIDDNFITLNIYQKELPTNINEAEINLGNNKNQKNKNYSTMNGPKKIIYYDNTRDNPYPSPLTDNLRNEIINNNRITKSTNPYQNNIVNINNYKGMNNQNNGLQNKNLVSAIEKNENKNIQIQVKKDINDLNNNKEEKKIPIWVIVLIIVLGIIFFPLVMVVLLCAYCCCKDKVEQKKRSLTKIKIIKK